jgi:glycosyltransferase involved in cell wall biosynthesis
MVNNMSAIQWDTSPTILAGTVNGRPLRIGSEAVCQYQGVVYGAPVVIADALRQAIMDCDILQCFDYYRFSAVACRLCHPCVILYLCENVPFNPAYAGRVLEDKQIIQQQARWIVANSRSVRDCLITEGVDPRKVVVDSFWTTPECFRPQFLPMTDEDTRRLWRQQLDLPPDIPLVVYAGRLNAAKGLRILETAMSELGKTQPVTTLCIGPVENYVPSSTGIRHLSPQIPGRLAVYINAADVVVLPSIPILMWVEQFGRVLVEAMACGCPVVATDLGGPRDIVVNGSTGFLVPPGNAVSLQGAIRRILEDKPLRDRMRRKARQWYLRRFAPLPTTRRFRRYYEAAYREAYGA